MDVFAVLLRSTRRLKMLLKSRSNTWQPSTTQHKNTHISSYLFPWLDCPLPSCDMFQVWNGLKTTLEHFVVRRCDLISSGERCRPFGRKWQWQLRFRLSKLFSTLNCFMICFINCQSAQIERETPKNVANERRFITAVATQVLASFSHQSWCQTSASLWNQAMTCLILSAEFLSSSQHSAALDSGHAGRDVLCIRDPKTWPCFGMAWLLLDSCFLLLVPHYRDKMGHPDPVWYCGTLYTLWPLRRWFRQVAKSKSLS